MKEEKKENQKQNGNVVNNQQQDGNYLKLFSLKFVNEKFEKHYTEDTNEQHQRLSYFITFIFVLYTFTAGVIIIVMYHDLNPMLANMSYSIINLILVFNIKKHFQIVSKLLFFSFISYIIVTMEVFIIGRMRKADNVDQQGYFFFTGQIQMSLMYAFAQAVHKWYLKAIIVEFGVIYYALRVSNPYHIVFTNYPIFYFMTFIFALLFYKKEKFERSVFYKLYKKQEENQAFKDLLENTVPSSIFVAKLRDQKQIQDSHFSPMKNISNKFHKLLSYCKNLCCKKKQTQVQNNNQHTILSNQNDNQPHQNTSNMKIVFANSHCKKQFATSNLEFLQKNMNYLFSHGSIQTLKENSQGRQEKY